ncbi:MAG TPA: hypothetical protein PKA41_02895, partial [Verrucomicrobiota bacterium]|nr:hypothetical protein [Verrucomicrobiota bacterium]
MKKQTPVSWFKIGLPAMVMAAAVACVIVGCAKSTHLTPMSSNAPSGTADLEIAPGFAGAFVLPPGDVLSCPSPASYTRHRDLSGS